MTKADHAGNKCIMYIYNNVQLYEYLIVFGCIIHFVSCMQNYNKPVRLNLYTN